MAFTDNLEEWMKWPNTVAGFQEAFRKLTSEVSNMMQVNAQLRQEVSLQKQQLDNMKATFRLQCENVQKGGGKRTETEEWLSCCYNCKDPAKNSLFVCDECCNMSVDQEEERGSMWTEEQMN
jgi:hypothetical protein